MCEPQVNVPSADAMIRPCLWMWSRTRSTLIGSSAAYRRAADWRKQAQYLSTALRAELSKLTPTFICPFPVFKVVNSSVVRLKPALIPHEQGEAG